jgi:hypothetical protein
MSTARCYRDQIMRASTGDRPAMICTAEDAAALDRICQRLVEAERAAEILQALGYGRPGMLLHEVAALVPAKP